MSEQNEKVSEYYGKTLSSSEDLKTSACCSIEAIPAYVKQVLVKIHPEIQNKFYGCGSPIPPAVDGLKVLDLGCGTGRDVYLLSSLVGEKGHVTGVDMTDQQLKVAEEHKDYHMQQFSYSVPNVSFVNANIEDLFSAGLQDNSFDLIVSNCVINLAESKEKVFHEIKRILKTGGELYFSDVFADRRVPEELIGDPVLLGECLSGAMYEEDFRRMNRRVFDAEYYQIARTPIEIEDANIAKKLAGINFCSITLRVFNLSLEDAEEDYGQVAEYNGNMSGYNDSFDLGNGLVFSKDKASKVSGNTAEVLTSSRYSKFFKVSKMGSHIGKFKANTSLSTMSCCC